MRSTCLRLNFKVLAAFLPSNKLPPSQHPPQIHIEAAVQRACELSGLSPHVVPFPDGYCKEQRDILQTEVVLIAHPCTCLSVAQRIRSLYWLPANSTSDMSEAKAARSTRNAKQDLTLQAVLWRSFRL